VPPAFSLGPIRPGDTTGNPEFDKARKQTILHTEMGRKAYKLELNMTIPAGFRRLTKKEYGPIFKDAAKISCILVAQDDKHNWAKIIIVHSSAKALGDQKKVFGDKKETFATWKSNWESKARGKKVPVKAKKVTWGKAKGKGYKLLRGEVSNWPGTFTGIIVEKSGWRTIIEVETRGQNADRFLKDIEAFFKKLKLNYKVK